MNPTAMKILRELQVSCEIPSPDLTVSDECFRAEPPHRNKPNNNLANGYTHSIRSYKEALCCQERGMKPTSKKSVIPETNERRERSHTYTTKNREDEYVIGKGTVDGIPKIIFSDAYIQRIAQRWERSLKHFGILRS